MTKLPRMEIEGLREIDARALLNAMWSAPIDARVRDQIIAETQGNPLALMELPRELAGHDLAGGFGIPTALRLSGRIEESYERRLAALPKATRRLLLIAAADPTGDSALVWRAAASLGIGPEAGEPAVSDGLLQFGFGCASDIRWCARRPTDPRR